MPNMSHVTGLGDTPPGHMRVPNPDAYRSAHYYPPPAAGIPPPSQYTSNHNNNNVNEGNCYKATDTSDDMYHHDMPPSYYPHQQIPTYGSYYGPPHLGITDNNRPMLPSHGPSGTVAPGAQVNMYAVQNVATPLSSMMHDNDDPAWYNQSSSMGSEHMINMLYMNNR